MTEQNHEISQSGHPVSGPRFESEYSRILQYSITDTFVMSRYYQLSSPHRCGEARQFCVLLVERWQSCMILDHVLTIPLNCYSATEMAAQPVLLWTVVRPWGELALVSGLKHVSFNSERQLAVKQSGKCRMTSCIYKSWRPPGHITSGRLTCDMKRCIHLFISISVNLTTRLYLSFFLKFLSFFLDCNLPDEDVLSWYHHKVKLRYLYHTCELKRVRYVFLSTFRCH
jgi:hypothetical protein